MTICEFIKPAGLLDDESDKSKQADVFFKPDELNLLIKRDTQCMFIEWDHRWNHMNKNL